MKKFLIVSCLLISSFGQNAAYAQKTNKSGKVISQCAFVSLDVDAWVAPNGKQMKVEDTSFLLTKIKDSGDFYRVVVRYSDLFSLGTFQIAKSIVKDKDSKELVLRSIDGERKLAMTDGEFHLVHENYLGDGKSLDKHAAIDASSSFSLKTVEELKKYLTGCTQ